MGEMEPNTTSCTEISLSTETRLYIKKQSHNLHSCGFGLSIRKLISLFDKTLTFPQGQLSKGSICPQTPASPGLACCLHQWYEGDWGLHFESCWELGHNGTHHVLVTLGALFPLHRSVILCSIEGNLHTFLHLLSAGLVLISEMASGKPSGRH